MSMQRYTFTLEAGKSINPNIPRSNFISVVSAVGLFTAYPADLTPLKLEKGISVRLNEQFNNLRIESEIDQTVEIYVGSGEVVDSRLILGGDALSIGGNAIANYGAESVLNTATLLAVQDDRRATILIQNLGSTPIFVGTDNLVTTANGLRVAGGASATFTFKTDIYAISAVSGQDVRFLEELTQ